MSARRGPRVLLLGASGFIGANLARALDAAGFEVITTCRRQCGAGQVQADFATDHDAQAWLARLADVDIVINAVGIFTERGAQTFEALHASAPRALFQACVTAGVRQVVQISALGAESRLTPYFRSKREADEFLMTLPIAWTIVCPSLVYGENGDSSRLFRMLASLPRIPLPGSGAQRVQPVHVDDFAEAVVAILRRAIQHRSIAVVGDAPMALRDYLRTLRAQMGLSAARFLPVPMPLMRWLAQFGQLIPGAILRPDALTMLNHESIGDAAPTIDLLGRHPRAVEQFISPQHAAELRRQARLQWLMPLLSLSMAVLWVASGVVSLWVYPRGASLELLAATGMPAALRPVALHLAAGVDMLLGLGCLLLARRSWIWMLQILLVLGYTLILTLKLPQFWAHPFGPLAKNIPILAVLVLLYIRARD